MTEREGGFDPTSNPKAAFNQDNPLQAAHILLFIRFLCPSRSFEYQRRRRRNHFN